MLCCIRLFPYVHLGRTYAQSLILRQSDENPEALVRIGIAEFLSNPWFDEKKDEILTIIWSDNDMIMSFSQDQIYFLYPLILQLSQLEPFKEDFLSGIGILQMQIIVFLIFFFAVLSVCTSLKVAFHYK